jgi:hypothetical protein
MHVLQDDQGTFPRYPVATISNEDAGHGLDLTLEYYDQENPGFLTLTASATELTIAAYTVPFSGAFVNKPADQVRIGLDGKLKP